ncbi:zinc ribbon domain-containing protein [Agathobaculum sp.]|uniref:zinc ribbon domain-containing protein n=1 Tax=Agathobaculum sp. TaxID=2048138 RepID=UPI002A80BBE2|nr:zinc ribbon domain-containing protein [Agathobaculum sp.]MDY3618248.1 zinc ribbon domain-containing protein [Agathobaculum sp.]
MKCQNCGVNYEDSERECPMCGTRAGARGRLSVPRYTDGTHTSHTKDTCTHQTYAQKYTDKSKRASSSAGSKGQAKKAAGAVLTIVIALSALLPAAFEYISNRAYDVSHWAQDLPQGGASAQATPAPEDDGSSDLIWANSVFGGGGVISLPDGGEFTLSIDEDDTYVLTRDDEWHYTERGEAWCWWNDPEDGLYPQSDSFPPEEYDSFTVCLAISGIEQYGVIPEPEAIDAHAEMGEMWLLAHCSKINGHIVLENWYGDGAFLFGEEAYLPYSGVQAG